MFPSTLRTSVPVYTGATSQTPGKAGLVPAANIGEQDYVFTGGGTYKQLTTLEVFNTFRKAFIGIPHPWSSTTLETGYTWADGGFVSFDDWPELKEKYEANGFDGMLLPWDADKDTITANLGKWRPNATNPTGLYTPSYGGQFSCAWVPGETKDAGTWWTDTGRSLTASWVTGWIDRYLPTIQTSGAIYTIESSAAEQIGTATTENVKQPFKAVFDSSRVWGEHSSNKFAPQHIQQPHVIYLGLTFDDYTNSIQKKMHNNKLSVGFPTDSFSYKNMFYMMAI